MHGRPCLCPLFKSLVFTEVQPSRIGSNGISKYLGRRGGAIDTDSEKGPRSPSAWRRLHSLMVLIWVVGGFCRRRHFRCRVDSLDFLRPVKRERRIPKLSLGIFSLKLSFLFFLSHLLVLYFDDPRSNGGSRVARSCMRKHWLLAPLMSLLRTTILPGSEFTVEHFVFSLVCVWSLTR